MAPWSGRGADAATRRLRTLDGHINQCLFLSYHITGRLIELVSVEATAKALSMTLACRLPLVKMKVANWLSVMLCHTNWHVSHFGNLLTQKRKVFFRQN